MASSADIALTLKSIVPGMNEAQFDEMALASKHDCARSKALALALALASTSMAEMSLREKLDKGVT